MNKLFKLTQAKGKWHKFPSFNLERREAKLYKNFAQKLLSVSLCAAMVLLGVPQGQNFVADAADEATKSVALLTLTLIGDKVEPDSGPVVIQKPGGGAVEEPAGGKEESYSAGDPSPEVNVEREETTEPGGGGAAAPTGDKGDLDLGLKPDNGGVEEAPPGAAASRVTATMEWKSFVPGTTVGLEVIFVDADGNASEPHDFGTWLDTYGSLRSTASAFVPFAPGAWLDSAPPDSGVSELFGSAWKPAALDFYRSFLALTDWFAPLPLGLDASSESPFVGSPGLARLPVGSALSLASHPFVALRRTAATDAGSALAYSWEADTAGASVAWLDPSSGSLTGVGAGAASFDLSVTMTLTEPGLEPEVIGPFPLGSIAVEVYEVDPAGPGFLFDTVQVNGNPQRLRVYDPNGVLPADTTFKAEYVDGSHGDHNFFITHLDPATDVELQHFYNLTLTSAGQTLSELDGPVELWFEAIDGIDAADSFISRVAEGADAKLTPTLYTDDDGVTWIKVLTDHFSPYALTDLLSAEEKAALAKENSGPKNNVKTGDHAAQLAVAGLGMVLVLALGIMLRLITSKKKFEE